jgi:DNA mismatch endonuclease (patch repair protein)
MADIVSKKKRSEMMSNIKGKNTKTELLVFSYLRKQGIYFQKHYKKVPGCPDVAIPSKKLAVFIDGDFWHAKGYPRCLQRLSPFWRQKIKANYLRDKKKRTQLSRLGWKTYRVWESALKKPDQRDLALLQVAKFLLGKTKMLIS